MSLSQMVGSGLSGGTLFLVWHRWMFLLVYSVSGSVGSIVLVCLVTLGGGTSVSTLKIPSESCSCGR